MNESVNHSSQFISVKVKKNLRKSQAQFREKLRELRLRQTNDFLIKKRVFEVNSVVWFSPGNEKCCRAFNRLVNFIGPNNWRFTTMFTLILSGKIFYTPDTPQTRRVVNQANTFITKVFYGLFIYLFS